MDIELAKQSSASSAATLVIEPFRRCAEGVVNISFNAYPGGPTLTGNPATTSHIEGETTTTKDGGQSTMLKVRVKTPIAQYNQNGTVVNSLPEVSAHVVLKVPKLIANAIQGTLTTSAASGQSANTNNSRDTAIYAVSRALAYLVTMMSGYPMDAGVIFDNFLSNPLYLGAIGVCPLDYEMGDYGTVRVQPPPARS